MTEKSFPIVNTPMGAAEWQTLALGFAQGVVDEGGWPYLLGAIDNVNNTITIRVDQITGVNKALLSGFAHRIDHEKVLTIPAVSTTTTYEVGLYYDPNSTAASGPISLTSWIAPGDYSGQKNRLILYRITRSANQVLSDAIVQEWRQRVSPRIAVSNKADLPKVETLLVDTVALVRNTNESYRLNKAADGTLSWTLVGTGDDAIEAWMAENASGANTPGHVVRRGADANFLVPSPPTHGNHPVPFSYAEDRYHRRGIDAISGNSINSRVPYEHVDGSRAAYDQIQSGTVYTVSVNANGDFMRFSSTERHKENASLWTPAPRRLLGADAWIYDRVDPETREVTNPREVGTIAERNAEALPEFVQWGPDHTNPEVGPQEELKVQGWDYQRWTAAHQRLHQWNTARVDAALTAVSRIAEETGVDVSDLLSGLEWQEGDTATDFAPTFGTTAVQEVQEVRPEASGPLVREIMDMGRRLDALAEENESLRRRLEKDGQ